MKIFRIISSLLLFNILIYAQSLSGFKGFFNIPTAEMMNDGEVLIGTNILSKNVSDYGNQKYDVLSAYITVQYLPRIEFSFRLNSFINVDRNNYTADRMFSVKFNILQETNLLPIVSVGLQNPYSTGGLDKGSLNFNSSYVVGTKSFLLSRINVVLRVTAGYGGKLVVASNYQYIGLFYGILLSKSFDAESHYICEMMIENDTKNMNAGLRIKIFDYFSVLVGFINMKNLSGGISLSFQL